LGKLKVASKTVLMNIDDQYSTLLVIISIQQFKNTFSAITTPTPICYPFLLKTFKKNVILSGRHVRLTLFTRLRLVSLLASINVITFIDNDNVPFMTKNRSSPHGKLPN